MNEAGTDISVVLQSFRLGRVLPSQSSQVWQHLGWEKQKVWARDPAPSHREEERSQER